MRFVLSARLILPVPVMCYPGTTSSQYKLGPGQPFSINIHCQHFAIWGRGVPGFAVSQKRQRAQMALLKEPTPEELQQEPAVVFHYMLKSNHCEKTLDFDHFIIALEGLYLDGDDLDAGIVAGLRKKVDKSGTGAVSLPVWTKFFKQWRKTGTSMREYTAQIKAEDTAAATPAAALVATAVRRGSLAAVTTTERRKSIAASGGGGNVDAARCATAADDLRHIFKDVIERGQCHSYLELFLLVSGGAGTIDEMHFLHVAELIEEDHHAREAAAGTHGGNDHTVIQLVELSEEERHFLFSQFVDIGDGAKDGRVNVAEFTTFCKSAGGEGRLDHRRTSVAVVAGLEKANAAAAAKSGACADGINNKEDHFRIHAEEKVTRGTSRRRKRKGTVKSRISNRRKRNKSKRAALSAAGGAQQSAAGPPTIKEEAEGGGVRTMTDDELHAAIATAEAEALAHEARASAKASSPQAARSSYEAAEAVSAATLEASEAAAMAAATQRGRRGSVARALAVLGAAANAAASAATSVALKAKGAVGVRKRRGTVNVIAATKKKGRNVRGSAVHRRRKKRDMSAEARAERIKKRHRGTELLDELARRDQKLVGSRRERRGGDDWLEVRLGRGALGFEVGWTDGHLAICGFLSRKKTKTARHLVATKSAENVVRAAAEAAEAEAEAEAEAAAAEAEAEAAAAGSKSEGGNHPQAEQPPAQATNGDPTPAPSTSIASRSAPLHLNDGILAANGFALPETSFEAARAALAEARAASPDLLVLGVRRRRAGPHVVSRQQTCAAGPLVSRTAAPDEQPRAARGDNDDAQQGGGGQQAAGALSTASLATTHAAAEDDHEDDHVVFVDGHPRRVADFLTHELVEALRGRGVGEHLLPPRAAKAASVGCFGRLCGSHSSALSQMLDEAGLDDDDNAGREFKPGDRVEACVHDGEWEAASIKSILQPPSYAKHEPVRIAVVLALDESVEFVGPDVLRFPLPLSKREISDEDVHVLADALERRQQHAAAATAAVAAQVPTEGDTASAAAEATALAPAPAPAPTAEEDAAGGAGTGAVRTRGPIGSVLLVGGADSDENLHDAFFSSMNVTSARVRQHHAEAPPTEREPTERETYASEINPATGAGVLATCLAAVKEEFRASFAEILAENGVDDIALLSLTESDLEAMGCKALWPRRQLAQAIEKERARSSLI